MGRIRQLCLKCEILTILMIGKGRDMEKDNKLRRDIMAEEIRLIYYNNYLLENGVITEREHKKMYSAILSHVAGRKKKELRFVSYEDRLSSRHS